MHLLRFGALALAPTLLTAPRAAHRSPSVVITVAPVSDASSSMRVIASGGIVKSGGRTYAAKSDTLRLSGTVEVAATEAVMIVSFIGDHGQFLRASVTEGGVENYTGRGEMIVIVRTPMGVQLEAMKAPDDAR